MADSTERKLALAVLEGDEQAVWPLVDHLLENHDKIRLPALRTLNVEVKHLRMIVFVDPSLGADVDVDMEGVEQRFRQWVSGERKTMGFTGIDRVEFYELKSQ